MCVLYYRNQAFYSANTETRLITSFLHCQRAGASGYHGYVQLKKTIELFSITIPFHLHHNTCQIRTELAHATTQSPLTFY